MRTYIYIYYDTMYINIYINNYIVYVRTKSILNFIVMRYNNNYKCCLQNLQN